MTAVRYLIVANVVVFALQPVFGDALIENFALWPLATNAAAGANSNHLEIEPFPLQQGTHG